MLALQSIAARGADPPKSIVLSVTSLRTESGTFNIVPAHVTLRGTVRTFDADLRKMAEARLKLISPHTAAG